MSRTERRLEALRTRETSGLTPTQRERLEEEQARISGMTIEEYRQHYPTMSGWMQSSFMPPTQAEQQLKEQQRVEGERQDAVIVGKMDVLSERIEETRQGMATADASDWRALNERIQQMENERNALAQMRQQAQTGQYDLNVLVSRAGQVARARTRSEAPTQAWQQPTLQMEVWSEKKPQQIIIREPEQTLMKAQPTSLGLFEPIAPLIYTTAQIVETGKEFVGFTGEKIGELYEKIPETQYLAPTFREYTGIGMETKYSISTGKPLIKYADIVGDRELLTKEIGELKKERLEKYGIIEATEPEFQEKFQKGFEERYTEVIETGQISFEEAKEIYAGTEYAKRIESQYGEALGIAEREAKLPIEKTSFQIWAKQTKAGLPQLKSDKELLVTIGAVTGAVYLFASLPPIVTGTYIGYRGVKGGVKLVSPLSLPEEKIAGAGEVVVSGAILTYGAVRYMKAPVIKTKTILPKAKLTKIQKATKISPSLQREIVRSGGKVYQRDLFRWTSKAEQVVEGRRTIVTTKIREIFKAPPIYKGVPYGKTQLQAYQKALSKLTKYGLTSAQAKATLRYYQPRAYIYETKGITAIITGTDLKKPILITKGARVTTPEVRVLDKALGIKTRGGIRRLDYISARGEQVAVKESNVLYRSVLVSEKAYLTKEGYPFTKIKDVGKLKTRFKQLTALEKRGEAKIFEFYKEKTVLKQFVPVKKIPFTKEGEVIVMKQIKQPPITEFDLDVLRGYKLKQIPKPPKKIPFVPIEQQSTQQLKTLIKDLTKVYGKPRVKRRKKLFAYRL